MYIDYRSRKNSCSRKRGRKIAVEVKSFFKTSVISEFHTALGQFINYRLALSEQEPDRILYLAVPIDTYTSFFTIRLVQSIIKTYQLKLITYQPVTEDIVEWIN